MAKVIEIPKINRRSKRQDDYQDRIDVLRSRVNLLEGKDRALMKMYLDNGETFAQMARLAGVNEATISKRIYKLTRRLLDGQYISILRNRNFFTKLDLKIAKDYFIRGLSMKKIKQKHKISFYRVRNTMKQIQELTEVKSAY